MAIYEFLDFCSDAGMLYVNIVKISDYEITEVYHGYGDEIPDELLYAEMLTYDIPEKAGEITINIE